VTGPPRFDCRRHQPREVNSRLIQFRTIGPASVILGAELEAEAIASKARKHMQVNVHDLLHGRFAVSEKEVHPLAAQAAGSERRRCVLGDAHESRRDLAVEIG